MSASGGSRLQLSNDSRAHQTRTPRAHSHGRAHHARRLGAHRARRRQRRSLLSRRLRAHGRPSARPWRHVRSRPARESGSLRRLRVDAAAVRARLGAHRRRVRNAVSLLSLYSNADAATCVTQGRSTLVQYVD